MHNHNGSTQRCAVRAALLGAAASWLIMGQAAAESSAPASAPAQPALGTRTAPVLTEAGLRFRDLNRNGTLDPYEDWRLPAETRARDLVGRMTLEEKAGAMMHGTLPANGVVGTGDRYTLPAASAFIRDLHINNFITRLAAAPRDFAEQNNALQAVAESTRLGIPLSISTDPRNHFQTLTGAASAAGSFSQWPETLGLGALDDPATTRRFADIARQEYAAVGIRVALSPQADLATEPRWARVTGTFGEDPERVGRQVEAYVAGFQNGSDGLNRNSVAAVVKHWAGYGAAKDGWDSHLHYGRFATFPGGRFADHLKPFEGAFRAGAASVMPTYSILENLKVDGRMVEQVGAGFNTWLLQDLLRGTYRFGGLIVSDWGITSDCPAACVDGSGPGKPPVIGMPWGVENLPRVERFARAINAGNDQIGGSEEGAQIVAAVKAGLITQARVDDATMRGMLQKFEMGLFENPFADPVRAEAVVNNAEFRAAALDAQRRALVMLENRNNLLPLRPSGQKLFLHGISADIARSQGFEVVDDPAKADLAVIRATTPHQLLHPDHFFGTLFHEGDLDFKPGNPDYEVILRASRSVPTIVTVYLDRPAILTNIREHSSALIGNFGVSDTALFDVLTGKAKAEGRLPFELPSSMDAVRAQASDVPHDSANPLYPIGFRHGD